MTGYCSWCLEKVDPTLIENTKFTRNLYSCPKCGRRLVECRGCSNYARWDTHIQKDRNGKVRKTRHHDQFCLEHRHEIPNFNAMKIRLKEPSDYGKVYEYNSANLAKAGKIAMVGGVSAVIGGPLFFVAAPAIGGAIGSIAGLSGAAATSYGLSFLGFGSLAAGGFGMAGGMAVCTSVGTALGGAVGAYVGNSYMGDIYKFNIKKVKSGAQPTIVTVNGFLSEKDKQNEKGFQEWERLVFEKYSDNEWYHVYWESQSCYDIGSLIAKEGGGTAVAAVVGSAAKHATKQALKKIGPAAGVLTIIQLSNNPWHVAMIKAEKTGALLADILSRTRKKYVLLGHSLGARVIYCTLRALATREKKIVEEVHLTGGAVDNDRENWKIAKNAVGKKIVNYYSNNDVVLKTLYKVGTFFASNPIGLHRIHKVNGIRNKDVSSRVGGHMKYKSNPRFTLQK